jgi:hypothetical protein
LRQRQRDREAERLGSLEIDRQRKFYGPVNGQIARFVALENTSDINAIVAIGIL